MRANISNSVNCCKVETAVYHWRLTKMIPKLQHVREWDKKWANKLYKRINTKDTKLNYADFKLASYHWKSSLHGVS